MQSITLESESAVWGDFYAPSFEVRIAGAGLPDDVVRDISSVTYRDNVKEIDSFEIEVNNWEPKTQSFKYVGTGDEREEEGPLAHVFDPSNKRVDVSMGYGGERRLVISGSFTTLAPHFPASGAPTLTVRGLNVLHQLRRKQYNTQWGDKKDSEIAENIATLVDRERGGKRFPLPIETDAEAKAAEEPVPFIAQKNQYDIDFLLGRARIRGYVVAVLDGSPNARQAPQRERRLYFGPSHAGLPALHRVTYELKWGVSLVEFMPTLTTANQVRSVTVNGWDRAARRAIRETVALDDRSLRINRDLHDLLLSGDPREEHVTDEPVYTRGQARDRARAILLDRHKEMVKATGSTIGLPDLRAGQRVRITGVGKRFQGTYFVTDTTHTVNDRGYTTQFGARREDEGEPST